MKYILYLLIMLLALNISAATYYCSPTGSDSNTGTIESPFFSLNKVWTVISAGDIVYLRGGTYAFTTQQNLNGKNGTSTNVITISGYPGEVPILSKGSGYPTTTFGIYFRGNYFHWINISIAGYTQPSSGVDSHGIRAENCNYNTFENLNIYNNGVGMALFTSNSSYHATGNLIINCDFHHNQDPLTSDAYGNGDGLAVSWNANTSDINYVRGCRFYWNSDDGIDLYMNDGTVEIENCQAYYNGYIPDTFTSAGDGNGFKLGTSNDYRNDVKRILKNCVSIKNKRHGIDINDELGIIKLYNCTSYLNGYSGIVLSTNNLVNYAYNCISYSNTNNNGLSTNGVYTNNSWQNGISVTSDDFLSLDLSLLTISRNTDNTLPITNLLHLKSGSDLINAGVNVGLPYYGSSSDIGAYEFYEESISGTTTTTTTTSLKRQLKVGTYKLKYNNKHLVY